MQTRRSDPPRFAVLAVLIGLRQLTAAPELRQARKIGDTSRADAIHANQSNERLVRHAAERSRGYDTLNHGAVG